jgi:hypothetical protein
MIIRKIATISGIFRIISHSLIRSALRQDRSPEFFGGLGFLVGESPTIKQILDTL